MDVCVGLEDGGNQVLRTSWQVILAQLHACMHMLKMYSTLFFFQLFQTEYSFFLYSVQLLMKPEFRRF